MSQNGETGQVRDQVRQAADAIRSRRPATPRLGLILGSGLGRYADTFRKKTVIPYDELPHFPRSGAPGHRGDLVLGEAEGIPAVALQGRVHRYEGYTMAQVAFPVRVLGSLGIRQLIVTNAAGGISPQFSPGDLMLITDHMNLMGGNPLVGINIDEFGPRFPDMSEAYNPAISKTRILTKIATFEMATQVDAIISVPVMKTHDQGQVTLALKNLKGLVTDADKRRIHLEGMFQGATDLVAHFTPVFTVVDAIIGQEGMGPLLGMPVEMGLVLAGADLGAIDAIAGLVMGFAPEEVPITREAAERGLGTLDESEIEGVGERVADVQRRFVRCEEDDRIDREGIEVVHSEGTCTGYRNGLLSSLFDMKADGTLERARGVTVIAGPTPVPEGIPQEMLVSVGSCSLPEARRLVRYVRGCPPNNVDIVRALLADR